MNKIYSIGIFCLAILSACQPPADSLSDLRTERDSLKSLVSDMNSRITEINKTIAESDSSFENSLTLVEASEISTERFEHYFNIYGQVETDKNALLFAESPGIITAISVREGQRVSKGAVIASIDNEIIRRQITEVNTALSLAETTYAKQKRLWDQKIGSEIQYLQAKNQKESLESSLATLRSQLNKTQVRAPFSGVVDEIFPNQGEMASPQMPIARVVNLDRMYIKSEVSERHLGSVAKGTMVRVDFPSIEESLEAEISETSSYINPENRSFKVKVELPESELPLRPNQLAHIRINDYSNEKAIVLPSNIVLQSASGEDFVYLISSNEGRNIAKKVNIQLGREYNGHVEVLEGLEPGNLVISKGAKSVRQGQRVRQS